MMGANWKRDTNQRRYFRRFAWWPVRSEPEKVYGLKIIMNNIHIMTIMVSHQ